MRKAAVAMIVGMLALMGSLALGPAPAHAEVVDSGMEAAFVAKINALRASKGLGQLAVYPELVTIARNWSQQMASAGAISHNPNFPNQVSANWRKLGENVGRGGSVDTLFTAFVNSPLHYENLVDPVYNYIGVGVVVSPDGTVWTAHQFMQLGAAAAPKPAAAPRAAPAPKPAPAPRVTTPRAPAAPRPASAPKPAAAAAPPTPPPAPAPAPKPEPPARVVMSLELLQGKSAA